MEFQNLEDFVLFLFIHMAWVDGSLHPNEKDTVMERMQDLFSDLTDGEQKLTHLESHYRNLGPGQVNTIIEAGIVTFSKLDPQVKRSIHTSLVDIVNANGKINSEETAALRDLKSWLTS